MKPSLIVTVESSNAQAASTRKRPRNRTRAVSHREIFREILLPRESVVRFGLATSTQSTANPNTAKAKLVTHTALYPVGKRHSNANATNGPSSEPPASSARCTANDVANSGGAVFSEMIASRG